MDNSKDRQMTGHTRVSVKGTAGGAVTVDISLDSKKPKLKIKVKGKLICTLDFDDVISNSMDDNALNKAFLKMWSKKFKQSSDMLDDFLACMSEDMEIEDEE